MANEENALQVYIDYVLAAYTTLRMLGYFYASAGVSPAFEKEFQCGLAQVKNLGADEAYQRTRELVEAKLESLGYTARINDGPTQALDTVADYLFTTLESLPVHLALRSSETGRALFCFGHLWHKTTGQNIPVAMLWSAYESIQRDELQQHHFVVRTGFKLKHAGESWSVVILH
ncbi:MAG TPA: hypothetical protein VNG90_00715 [Candidatus Acidoferrum sp.]|nr:hypothetical protein [Candidatus Acidoferrum sp.]